MGSSKKDGNGRAPTITAAAYVRMSTKQQKESPAQQRKHILRLADRMGFDISKWYQDFAKSGNDIKRRTDFKRMIADSCDGRFQAILCWSLDRFGRFDSIDAAGQLNGPGN